MPSPRNQSSPSFYGIPIREITKYGMGGIFIGILVYWFTVFHLQPAAVERKLLIDATVSTLESNAKSMEAVAHTMENIDTKIDILIRTGE